MSSAFLWGRSPSCFTLHGSWSLPQFGNAIAKIARVAKSNCYARRFARAIAKAIAMIARIAKATAMIPQVARETAKETATCKSDRNEGHNLQEQSQWYQVWSQQELLENLKVHQQWCCSNKNAANLQYFAPMAAIIKLWQKLDNQLEKHQIRLGQIEKELDCFVVFGVGEGTKVSVSKWNKRLG